MAYYDDARRAWYITDSLGNERKADSEEIAEAMQQLNNQGTLSSPDFAGRRRTQSGWLG